MILTRDDAGSGAHAAFRTARAAEQQYARQLRAVAEQVGHIVRAFPEGTPDAARRIAEMLQSYSELIGPWARAVARRMLADVSSRNAKAWRQYAAQMSTALRQELQRAPTGAAQAALLEQQVGLIRSIPLDAAQKVHEWTRQGLLTGERPAQVVEGIMDLTGITKRRATLIARTEAGRASTTLTQARAEYVGSTGYIWRTARDGAVRPSHRHMEGQFVRWDRPPTLDGMTGHCGSLPNCRCWPETVLPEIGARAVG